jgi:hypothetical protein
LDGLGNGSSRTVSLSLSIYTSSLLRRPLLLVAEVRLPLELLPALSTTLTSSTLVAGGVVGTSGASGAAGGVDDAGGDDAAGGAGSALGGVTVLINGGREDRGPGTYSTAGFRSQTTVSEIRARATGRVVVMMVVFRIGAALLANSIS